MLVQDKAENTLLPPHHKVFPGSWCVREGWRHSAPTSPTHQAGNTTLINNINILSTL